MPFNIRTILGISVTILCSVPGVFAENVTAEESLQYSLNQLKGTTDSLKERNGDLSRQNSALRAQLASLQKNSDQSTLPDGRTDHAELARAPEPMSASDEDAIRQNLQEKYDRFKKEESNLKQKISAKRARQTDMENKIKEMQEHIVQLNKSVTHAKDGRSSDIQTVKKDLKKEIQQSEARIKHLKAGSGRAGSSKKNDDPQTLLSSRDTLATKIDGLQNELAALLEEEKTSQDVTWMPEEDLTQNNAALDGEIANLQARQKELSEYVNLVRDKFKADHMVSLKESDEDKTLQENIVSLKKQNDFLQEENVKLMGALVKLDRRKLKTKWALAEAKTDTSSKPSAEGNR